jgi:histidinol-phosphate aminotransferase
VVFARTLSKFYGLAGARIGFGICPEKAKEIIDLDLPTFRTSIISRKLGAAALKDIDYYSDFKKKIITARDYFITELNKISGVTAFDSEANFVFVKFSTPDVKEVKSWLTKSNTLVRLVSEGETQGLRITIGRKNIMDDILRIISTGIGNS